MANAGRAFFIIVWRMAVVWVRLVLTATTARQRKASAAGTACAENVVGSRPRFRHGHSLPQFALLTVNIGLGV